MRLMASVFASPSADSADDAADDSHHDSLCCGDQVVLTMHCTAVADGIGKQMMTQPTAAEMNFMTGQLVPPQQLAQAGQLLPSAKSAMTHLL